MNSNIDLTCIICLEVIINYKDKRTLSCEHMFHKKCYETYNKNTCPICKKENHYNNDSDNNDYNNIDDYIIEELDIHDFQYYINNINNILVTRIPNTSPITIPPINNIIRTRNDRTIILPDLIIRENSYNIARPRWRY
jgi:hypothetical protein